MELVVAVGVVRLHGVGHQQRAQIGVPRARLGKEEHAQLGRVEEAVRRRRPVGASVGKRKERAAVKALRVLQPHRARVVELLAVDAVVAVLVEVRKDLAGLGERARVARHHGVAQLRLHGGAQLAHGQLAVLVGVELGKHLLHARLVDRLLVRVVVEDAAAAVVPERRAEHLLGEAAVRVARGRGLQQLAVVLVLVDVGELADQRRHRRRRREEEERAERAGHLCRESRARSRSKFRGISQARLPRFSRGLCWRA